MHPTDSKSQFIELRAKGWSLNRISVQIGVCKRTLVDWNRQSSLELEELRALELEALEERILASHEEELQRLVTHQKAIEQELLGRRYATLPTDKLFRLSALVRDQILKLRQRSEAAASLATRPPATPPAAAAAADA
jgi:lambda repressor-like predicted transcriptional regulator